MKCIFLIFFVSVILQATMCMINFSDSYEQEFKKIIEECQANKETQASEEWLKTEDLETADEEGPHILCRLTKIGSLKENGDVDDVAMRKDLAKGIDDEEIVNKIMKKCGTRPPGLTAIKSAVVNFKCVLSTYKELSDKE